MSVYFMFAHADLIQEEFDTHYKPTILLKMQDSDAQFICSDSFHQALAFFEPYPHRLTVYRTHITSENLINAKFKIVGGFHDNRSRDLTMTTSSTEDIAWNRTEPIDLRRKRLEHLGISNVSRRNSVELNLEHRYRKNTNSPTFRNNSPFKEPTSPHFHLEKYSE